MNVIKENNNLRANNGRYLNQKYNFRNIQPNLNLNNNYRTNNFNYEKRNVILKGNIILIIHIEIIKQKRLI